MTGIALAALAGLVAVAWVFVKAAWDSAREYLSPRPIPSPAPLPRVSEDDGLVTYEAVARWLPMQTRVDIERENGCDHQWEVRAEIMSFDSSLPVRTCRNCRECGVPAPVEEKVR